MDYSRYRRGVALLTLGIGYPLRAQHPSSVLTGTVLETLTRTPIPAVYLADGHLPPVCVRVDQPDSIPTSHRCRLTAPPGYVRAQNDAVANLMYQNQQRVRVSAPSLSRAPIVGRLAHVDSLSLSITVTRKGSTLSIPLGDVTGIATSGGIDRRKGALRGALVGAALGTIFFADTRDELKDDQFGLGTLVVALVSFGVTPTLGALAGAALAPERWDPATVPRRLAVEPARPVIRFMPDEHVRLATNRGTYSGRVQSHTNGLVTLSTSRGSEPVSWSDVSRVSVRGEPSRRRGAVRGAIVATAITAVGIATDPLPTATQNAGVVLGNAAFGALVGAFFPSRPWTDLLVPRATR